MLDEDAIKEFKIIWKKKYENDLSDADATRMAIALVNLVKEVYRPIQQTD